MLSAIFSWRGNSLTNHLDARLARLQAEVRRKSKRNEGSRPFEDCRCGLSELLRFLGNPNGTKVPCCSKIAGVVYGTPLLSRGGVAEGRGGVGRKRLRQQSFQNVDRGSERRARSRITPASGLRGPNRAASPARSYTYSPVGIS
jgi:hypothetical protein